MGSVVCFPIMLSLYRKVADNLVLLGKLQANLTINSLNITTIDPW